MSEVVVVALLKVKDGMVDQAIEGLTPVIEETHKEEGCIAYALHREQSDPKSMVLVERWRSQDDLNAHFSQPHMAKLGALAAEVLDEQPRILFCSGIPTGDPVKGVL